MGQGDDDDDDDGNICHWFVGQKAELTQANVSKFLGQGKEMTKWCDMCFYHTS